MPNGISCAYFAGKNLIYGQKENNVFKEGIAGIQTTRTIDSAAQAGVLKVPFSGTLNKVTLAIKKLLYPLIILSGAYNTIKSDDKVKTGIQQAGGISSMYVFEKFAEKGLNKIEKKFCSTNTIKNNKKLSVGLYILKGLAFISASLTGYNLGNKFATKAVDTIRNSKQEQNPASTTKNEDISSLSDENSLKINNDENQTKEKTFEDIV